MESKTLASIRKLIDLSGDSNLAKINQLDDKQLATLFECFNPDKQIWIEKLRKNIN